MPDNTPITPSTLARLGQFDTPTICNVIELFDVRPRDRGYMDHRIRCDFPDLPPMVGLAATAAFRSAGAPPEGDAYGSLEDQIEVFEELGGPPVVVFQDLDDPPAAAVFGEVMCTAYRTFGAAGLVTNGAGRDLDQVRAFDFPVFTGSTISAHGYCRTLHIGQPVRVGGLVVNQGDLLHGDRNGVTSIPRHIAAEAADAAGEFMAAEAIVLDYLNGPGPKTRAEFAEANNESDAAVARLQAEIGARRPREEAEAR